MVYMLRDIRHGEQLGYFDFQDERASSSKRSRWTFRLRGKEAGV